jgi:hypothetical protein
VPPLRPLRQFQIIAILMANWYEQSRYQPGTPLERDAERYK